MSMGIVHLYGQSAQHMDAFIMGDEEGLIALRNAISEAISGEEKSKVEVYCNDGEGYSVYVKVISDIFHADINKLPVPYIQPITQQKRNISENLQETEGKIEY